MYRFAAFVAAIAIAAPVYAQDDARWLESPQFFFANELPSGTGTYAEDEVLVSIPARWLRAVRLQGDVTVEIGRKQHEFRSGDVLPQLLFMPDGTEASTEIAYCTPRNRGENSTRSGILGSLFGGTLTDSIARSSTDTQYCLQDLDGDGTFDASFLVGEGRNNFVRGGEISAPPYETADEAAISPEDEVRLIVDLVGSLGAAIRLEFIQQGHDLEFDEVTSGAFTARRDNLIAFAESGATEVQILSIMFQIVGNDVDDASITVNWIDVQKDIRVTIPDNYTRSVESWPY